MTVQLIKTQCIVANITKRGSAFLNIPKSSDSVFLSPTISRDMGLNRGDVVEVVAYESGPEHTCKYTASKVSRVDPPDVIDAPSVEVEPYDGDVASAIVRMIQDTDGSYLENEICMELGLSGEKVRAALNAMHRAGRVAKAEIRQSEGQERPEVLWALSQGDFLDT